MSNDFGSPESIDKAMDTLLISVAKFNDVLEKHGIPRVTAPTRHTPIEPFFYDMIKVIEMLVPLVKS